MRLIVWDHYYDRGGKLWIDANSLVEPEKVFHGGEKLDGSSGYISYVYLGSRICLEVELTKPEVKNERQPESKRPIPIPDQSTVRYTVNADDLGGG